MTDIKKCDIGYGCGNACISKEDRCLKNVGEKIGGLTGRFIDLIIRHSQPQPQPKKIGGLTSKAVQFVLDKIAERSQQQPQYPGPDKKFLQKVKKIANGRKPKDTKLNIDEISAITSWKQTGYAAMNAILLGSEHKSAVAERVINAARGLKKLPSYTEKDIENQVSEYEGSARKDGKLSRGISGIKDLNKFLKPYEEALSSGKTHEEPTFFATTYLEGNHFLENAQVEYVVGHKKDGTGQGKLVDNFSKDLKEGEVLFQPYSKFKITNIERTKIQEQAIDMELVNESKNNLPSKYKFLTSSTIANESRRIMREHSKLKEYSSKLNIISTLGDTNKELADKLKKEADEIKNELINKAQYQPTDFEPENLAKSIKAIKKSSKVIEREKVVIHMEE